MANLTFTKEEWGKTVTHGDILECLVWEDESDTDRWEEHHTGVFKWDDGKYYMAFWTTGLTEYQENTWFEHYTRGDGGIAFVEAEQYQVIETKWRVKP